MIHLEQPAVEAHFVTARIYEQGKKRRAVPSKSGTARNFRSGGGGGASAGRGYLTVSEPFGAEVGAALDCRSR